MTRRTATLLAGAACWLAATAVQATDATCLPDGSGYLSARVRGDLNLDIDWRGKGLACTGMPRPDGRGMRLRFAAKLPDGSALAFVFAPPVLAEGATARAVPVNVTVLTEGGGRIYATRGGQRCTLDEVRQQRLPDTADTDRAWAVTARGFCTGPARALVGDGDLLLTRFDFRGLVTFRDTVKDDKP